MHSWVLVVSMKQKFVTNPCALFKNVLTNVILMHQEFVTYPSTHLEEMFWQILISRNFMTLRKGFKIVCKYYKA